jgi:two-component system CheB/CheR fusion protein
MVELYAPPSILVDDELEVVHISEHAGRYLTFGGGEPTRQLLRLVHPALRFDLRAALYNARQPDAGSENRAIRYDDDGVERVVQIRVRTASVEGISRQLLLVMFDERQHERVTDSPVSDAAPGSASLEPVVHELENELERTRDHLRNTVEQYEISLEELKASNEELHAMNEELRSTTEELETGREELQAVNEEMITVNQELKVKVDEVSRANSDLQNLMSSTEIAVVFLDRNLNIKRFTERAKDLFNVIGSDIGRPLTDLTHRLELPDLTASAARVLQDLRMVEREARSEDGRSYLVRLLPYRSIDDRIDGVVLTFQRTSRPPS